MDAVGPAVGTAAGITVDRAVGLASAMLLVVLSA